MAKPTFSPTIKPTGLPLRPLPLALLIAFAVGEIPRLVARGLIEPVANIHPQRYRLTPFGRRLLLAERVQSADRFHLLQARL